MSPQAKKQTANAGIGALGAAIGSFGVGILIEWGFIPRDTGPFSLALYNFMFVVPLALVLALSANEKVLQRLEEEEKKNRKLFKLAMGLMMMVFALYILFGGVM